MPQCNESTINIIVCRQYFRFVSSDFNIYLLKLDVPPPLWSGGQSSWLQIQRLEFDSGHYQIFWEVEGLERGQISLVSTTDGLLGSDGSVLEHQEYSRRDPALWPCDTLYPQKLAITSPTSGGRSVGLVRSRTKATVIIIIIIIIIIITYYYLLYYFSHDIYTDHWASMACCGLASLLAFLPFVVIIIIIITIIIIIYF
jgi:hypothetical protein